VKIMVPVKQAAVLDEEFELLEDGRGVNPDDLSWELNEWDAFSLEAALQLSESGGDQDHEAIVVTVGDEQADEGLLSCLAKGADRALRVWDASLEGADALAVARVLAAVAEREAPSVVLCGVQSSDAVNGATGVALAGFLDMPHVAVVTRLEYDADQASATVERELEGGLVEVVRIALPALFTVQTGINQPRYANLRAIKQAREKPLEVVSLSDLGLRSEQVEAATGSRLRRLAEPEAGQSAEMLEGSPADVASRIIEIVRERVSA
jgi:electron transfer flavoprotein beta subunit